MSSRRAFACLALLLLARPAPAFAAEDAAKQACIDAHAETQRRRQRGELAAARDAAVTCAQPACPELVRTECLRWVPELELGIPTVVIETLDGADTAPDARVLVDGVEVPPHLRGRALPLDPGAHTFVAALADGRVVEQRVLLHEAEKRHRVVLVVPRPAAADAEPAPSAPIAPPRPGSPPPGPAAPAARATWPVWLAGGTAVAAFGAFAWLGVAGKEKEAAMRASCAPRCSADDVHAMRRDYLLADLSLGLALVATGATVWLHVAGTRIEATPAPVRAGAGVALGSRF